MLNRTSELLNFQDTLQHVLSFGIGNPTANLQPMKIYRYLDELNYTRERLMIE